MQIEDELFSQKTVNMAYEHLGEVIHLTHPRNDDLRPSAVLQGPED